MLEAQFAAILRVAARAPEGAVRVMLPMVTVPEEPVVAAPDSTDTPPLEPAPSEDSWRS